MTLFSVFSGSCAHNRTAGGRIKWEEDNRSGLGFEYHVDLKIENKLIKTVQRLMNEIDEKLLKNS